MEQTEKLQLLSEAAPLLCEWFRQEGTALPWRGEVSPYEVLVSEIMLQQTRIKTVLEAYPRFLKAFPDLSALAAASEEAVLKVWEGLGYYSRARNLRKTAIVCMEKHGGNLPQSFNDLLKLPGLGRYTAGAVASLAFGEPVSAVDGNVLRVLSRLFADSRPVNAPGMKEEASALIEAVLPETQPGMFNEGLMELGEHICLPKGSPLCGSCPLSALCMACRANTVGEYPRKTEKKPRNIEEKSIFILKHRGKTAIRRRPESGLLGSLYEFPSLTGFFSGESVQALLPGAELKPLGEAKHIFTHIEWRMEGWLAELSETAQAKRLFPDIRFAAAEELREKYPIPTAFRAFLPAAMNFTEGE